MISITGIDKICLLMDLCNHARAKPQNIVNVFEDFMEYNDAKKILAKRKNDIEINSEKDFYFESVTNERTAKTYLLQINLGGPECDTSSYNAIYGENSAENIIRKILISPRHTQIMEATIDNVSIDSHSIRSSTSQYQFINR